MYEATGELNLTATKTVNGQTPTAEQVFSFKLTSGTDTPTVSQTKQNAQGSITFDAIPYTLSDVGKTYQYTVKETSTDGSGMTVDTTVYTVSVAITDNKNGSIPAGMSQ